MFTAISMAICLLVVFVYVVYKTRQINVSEMCIRDSPKTVLNICQIIASAMKLAKKQRIIVADPAEAGTSGDENTAH